MDEVRREIGVETGGSTRRDVSNMADCAFGDSEHKLEAYSKEEGRKRSYSFIYYQEKRAPQPGAQER